MSLAYNALLTGARKGMVLNGMIHPAVMRTFSKNVIERFKVKCGDEQSVASSLSGGNLQKYIVGRETMLQPKMMIVAQPTWGVDVGAAQLIRQALIDLRDQGVAILVISEELDELFTISDRLCGAGRGAAFAFGQAGRDIDRTNRDLDERQIRRQGKRRLGFRKFAPGDC